MKIKNKKMLFNSYLEGHNDFSNKQSKLVFFFGESERSHVSKVGKHKEARKDFGEQQERELRELNDYIQSLKAALKISPGHDDLEEELAKCEAEKVKLEKKQAEYLKAKAKLTKSTKDRLFKLAKETLKNKKSIKSINSDLYKKLDGMKKKNAGLDKNMQLDLLQNAGAVSNVLSSLGLPAGKSGQFLRNLLYGGLFSNVPRKIDADDILDALGDLGTNNFDQIIIRGYFGQKVEKSKIGGFTAKIEKMLNAVSNLKLSKSAFERGVQEERKDNKDTLDQIVDFDRDNKIEGYHNDKEGLKSALEGDKQKVNILGDLAVSELGLKNQIEEACLNNEGKVDQGKVAGLLKMAENRGEDYKKHLNRKIKVIKKISGKEDIDDKKKEFLKDKLKYLQKEDKLIKEQLEKAKDQKIVYQRLGFKELMQSSGMHLAEHPDVQELFDSNLLFTSAELRSAAVNGTLLPLVKKSLKEKISDQKIDSIVSNEELGNYLQGMNTDNPQLLKLKQNYGEVNKLQAEIAKKGVDLSEKLYSKVLFYVFLHGHYEDQRVMRGGREIDKNNRYLISPGVAGGIPLYEENGVQYSFVWAAGVTHEKDFNNDRSVNPLVYGGLTAHKNLNDKVSVGVGLGTNQDLNLQTGAGVQVKNVIGEWNADFGIHHGLDNAYLTGFAGLSRNPVEHFHRKITENINNSDLGLKAKLEGNVLDIEPPSLEDILNYKSYPQHIDTQAEKVHYFYRHVISEEVQIAKENCGHFLIDRVGIAYNSLMNFPMLALGFTIRGDEYRHLKGLDLDVFKKQRELNEQLALLESFAPEEKFVISTSAVSKTETFRVVQAKDGEFKKEHQSVSLPEDDETEDPEINLNEKYLAPFIEMGWEAKIKNNTLIVNPKMRNAVLTELVLMDEVKGKWKLKDNGSISIPLGNAYEIPLVRQKVLSASMTRLSKNVILIGNQRSNFNLENITQAEEKANQVVRYFENKAGETQHELINCRSKAKDEWDGHNSVEVAEILNPTVVSMEVVKEFFENILNNKERDYENDEQKAEAGLHLKLQEKSRKVYREILENSDSVQLDNVKNLFLNKQKGAKELTEQNFADFKEKIKRHKLELNSLTEDEHWDARMVGAGLFSKSVQRTPAENKLCQDIKKNDNAQSNPELRQRVLDFAKGKKYELEINKEKEFLFAQAVIRHVQGHMTVEAIFEKVKTEKENEANLSADYKGKVEKYITDFSAKLSAAKYPQAFVKKVQAKLQKKFEQIEGNSRAELAEASVLLKKGAQVDMYANVGKKAPEIRHFFVLQKEFGMIAEQLSETDEKEMRTAYIEKHQNVIQAQIKGALGVDDLKGEYAWEKIEGAFAKNEEFKLEIGDNKDIKLKLDIKLGFAYDEAGSMGVNCLNPSLAHNVLIATEKLLSVDTIQLKDSFIKVHARTDKFQTAATMIGLGGGVSGKTDTINVRVQPGTVDGANVIGPVNTADNANVIDGGTTDNTGTTPDDISNGGGWR